MIKEQKIYAPIGDWLIQNKGCQRNDFFRGYCVEPRIKGRRPDLVGVRYERKDQKYPAYDFHFYFVEVKGKIGSPFSLAQSLISLGIKSEGKAA